MKKLYRFVANGLGIYAAVEKACPKDDARRIGKPDGSWLTKAGPQFPDAISFWTRAGVEQYIESGLFSWHRSVIDMPIAVQIANMPAVVLFRDDFQVICLADSVIVTETLAAEHFLKSLPNVHN